VWPVASPIRPDRVLGGGEPDSRLSVLSHLLADRHGCACQVGPNCRKYSFKGQIISSPKTLN
jgi:hypothetical protein